MRLLTYHSRSLFASCAFLCFSKQKVDHHINVLHSYNEIKDVVQSLMGEGRSSAVQGGGRMWARVWRRSLRFGLRQLARVVAEWLRPCFLHSLLASLQASAPSSRANESRKCTKNLDWNWTTESTRAHQHAHRLPLFCAASQHSPSLSPPSPRMPLTAAAVACGISP